MAATSRALAIRRVLATPQVYRVRYKPEQELVGIIDIFLKAIATGIPTCHACAIAGLSYNTTRTWLNPKHKQYRAGLYREFQKAKATCVIRHIEKLNDSEDWRAHAFWLERRCSEFARRKAEHMEDEEDELKGAANKPFIMTPETIKELSEAYDRSRAEREADKAMKEANGDGE